MIPLRMKTFFTLSIVASFVMACAAYDPLIDEYIPKKFDPYSINGSYANKPVYRSENSGLLGPDDFGILIGFYAVKADTIILHFSSKGRLVVKLLQNQIVFYEKIYKQGEDFKILNDGRIELKRTHAAGGFDSPVFGYANNKVTLHLDDYNDLVVIVSGGGVGMIGIIPMAVYAKLMSIYPRINKL